MENTGKMEKLNFEKVESKRLCYPLVDTRGLRVMASRVNHQPVFGISAWVTDKIKEFSKCGKEINRK